MFDDDFDYITPDIDNEYEEPDTWTITSALDRVLSVVLEERLSKKFWEKAKNPIDYLPLNKPIPLITEETDNSHIIFAKGFRIGRR